MNRSATDSVKSTTNKIKLPSSVPSMKISETKPSIIKAMSAGCKLVDARLTHIKGAVALDNELR